MICPKCKATPPDGAIYCPACGKKLTVTKKSRAKSRGNGIGCAYYDSAHRYWIAQVVDGYRKPEDESKQWIPIKKTKWGFKRREDALAYCQTLKNAKPELPQRTLADVYKEWEPWYSPRVDPDTFGCYRAAYNYYKTLHQTNVREITAGDLQK